MKRLSCVVGFVFALGAAGTLFADGDMQDVIPVVIVSASSSSLENGGSSASAKSSSSVKQSSSSRSLDDSPLLPVISHDTLRRSLPENGEASMSLPRNIPAAVEQGEGRWFDLQGRLLKGKPTVKGTYYHNGKAVVVK